jgi:prepilin-type processing-associated H-X9-DG protein
VGKNEKAYVESNFGMRVADDKAILTKKVKAANRLRDARDGLSYSLMYTECAGKPQIWCKDQLLDGQNLKTGWASHATGFDPRMLVPSGCAGIGPCSVNCCNDQAIYAFHPTGANAGFGDGSVRFLDESIAPPVFVAILTRANRDSYELP